jgi:hypothetical protein
MYWDLDLEGEVHSIWALKLCRLQECNGNLFYEAGQGMQQFSMEIK